MKLLSPRVFFLLLATLFAASADFAQQPQEARQFDEEPGRPNLVQTLGLSQDQIREMRLLNQRRKPQMESALHHLREANRALDLAVYADTLDEADVQAKLKAFRDAQAEVARIRFNSELAIRKILTPEQLVHFRELRSQAREENIRHRRDLPPAERRRWRQMRRRP